MLKYDFKELDKPVVIDEPAIQDIFITNKDITIAVTTAAGQDETKLELEDGESARFTVQIGNVEPIKFGGTDNWGYNKLILYMDPEANSVEYDSIVVNDITVDPEAGENGWCRCEKINDSTLKYTALTANNSSRPRYAYFKHKTTDIIIPGGQNEGRPALSEWYVTVMQKGTDDPQPEPTPEPTPDPQPDPDPSDLGNFLYKVGLISDLHISADNNEGWDGTGRTPTTSDDNWWDEDDFRKAMNVVKDDTSIKFVASCGDIIESGDPSTATPEDDMSVFYNLYRGKIGGDYTNEYWGMYGIRFFTPLGNHDFYGLNESRNNDQINPERFKNDTSIIGYSGYSDNGIFYPGIFERNNKEWPIDDWINGINENVGRITFEPIGPDPRELVGQNDINFFSYNAYIEMYKNNAGYTDPLTPTENRFSDTAITTMTNYVMNNWETCKNNLSGWYDGYEGMRNSYSKKSFWLKKGNDIFIFLSVDYGNDEWQLTDSWHDRMIYARTIIPTDNVAQSTNPYIKRMVEYVDGTDYDINIDGDYNYQYYSPNALIWVKELIEHYHDKKVYVFTHHFMPHRVGNGDPEHDNLPKDGGYHYSSIHKDGELTTEQTSGIRYNAGSNTITGITFWFLNKLMNKHKNVIWFSGHSHISWENDCHFSNKDYNIVSPSENSPYVYTRDSNTPKPGTSAWNVSLPSLSKPRYISNNSSSRIFEDAEMGIMEIYEKGVKIKGYKIRDDNQDLDNIELLREKSIKLID